MKKVLEELKIIIKRERVLKLGAITMLFATLIAVTACDGTKITSEEVVRNDAYSYATIKNDDCNLEKGKTVTIQQGKNGTREIKERVTFTDGKETNREKLSEIVTVKPVDEILNIGGLDVRQVSENQPLTFSVVYRDNPNKPEGQETTVQEGKNGSQTVTYEVTYKCGKQEGEKKPVGAPKVVTPATEKIIERGTKSPSNCDPNYSGCVPIASDVDCAGGSGNGPAYTSGPVTVIGSDIYGLDRDGDGVGCE